MRSVSAYIIAGLVSVTGASGGFVHAVHAARETAAATVPDATAGIAAEHLAPKRIQLADDWESRL